MKVQLFTVINCIACSAHKKEVTALLENENIDLRIIDVDDEKYLYMALNAMKKYGIEKTPSMLLLNDKDEAIKIIQGIRGSIDKLKTSIDEERNSNE